MPNLKHLLDEIEDLGADPNSVYIPAPLYDEMRNDAAESVEEDE